MAGDIDEIVADYTDDAVFITPHGVLRGKRRTLSGFTRDGRYRTSEDR